MPWPDLGLSNQCPQNLNRNAPDQKLTPRQMGTSAPNGNKSECRPIHAPEAYCRCNLARAANPDHRHQASQRKAETVPGPVPTKRLPPSCL